MKLTSSQVKNLIRRSLRLIVDPEPEPHDRTRCIGFFQHTCAYCGEPIAQGRGDLDHLVSAARGGRNHISNRVFSCKLCNAELKRDKDWQDFLKERHGLGSEYSARRQEILVWVQNAGAAPPLSTDMLMLLEQAAESATAAYDEACRRVRGG
jgi:hypothetical protein